MRKVLSIALLLNLVGITPLHAGEISRTSVRNCVNIATGDARLVSEKVTKCSKSEKLVKLVIPALAPESVVHTGSGAPVDFQTGHDGDFYIDSAAKKIYGPRIAGVWGAGSSMIGELGAVGKTGAALISGMAAPDSQTGFVGDFYLDITTKMIYGPKSERAGWGVGSSITGPQGPVGSQGPTGATGAAGAPGGFGAYGSFYDTTTVILVQNVATPIPLGITQFAKDITVTSGSKITFSTSGKFSIAFSSQVIKEDAGDDTISIWLCKGSNAGACTNVPWTNTDMIFSGANSRNVAAWNFFVDATSGDYFQLMISSAGTTLRTKILSVPAQSSPARPEIPGTILTVNQVG
ncbi:MAG: hypothetical protein ACKOVI_01600 [Candidatus Planktophila sp.]